MESFECFYEAHRRDVLRASGMLIGLPKTQASQVVNAIKSPKWIVADFGAFNILDPFDVDESHKYQMIDKYDFASDNTALGNVDGNIFYDALKLTSKGDLKVFMPADDPGVQQFLELRARAQMSDKENLTGLKKIFNTKILKPLVNQIFGNSDIVEKLYAKTMLKKNRDGKSAIDYIHNFVKDAAYNIDLEEEGFGDMDFHAYMNEHINGTIDETTEDWVDTLYHLGIIDDAAIDGEDEKLGIFVDVEASVVDSVSRWIEGLVDLDKWASVYNKRMMDKKKQEELEKQKELERRRFRNRPRMHPVGSGNNEYDPGLYENFDSLYEKIIK